MKTLSKQLEKLSSELPQGEKAVIAIAGKMASGKNYISAELEKLGWKAIDADKLVHSAINQATEQIYETFKNQAEVQKISILNEDKTINRRELGKLLFANPELLAKQEQIVYPIITQMVKDFILQNSKTIINATVLYKTPDLLDLCQLVLYVKANFFKRVTRIRRRDSMAFSQIFSRMNSQKNLFKLYKDTGKKIIVIKN